MAHTGYSTAVNDNSMSLFVNKSDISPNWSPPVPVETIILSEELTCHHQLCTVLQLPSQVTLSALSSTTSGPEYI